MRKEIRMKIEEWQRRAFEELEAERVAQDMRRFDEEIEPAYRED